MCGLIHMLQNNKLHFHNIHVFLQPTDFVVLQAVNTANFSVAITCSKYLKSVIVRLFKH